MTHPVQLPCDPIEQTPADQSKSRRFAQERGPANGLHEAIMFMPTEIIVVASLAQSLFLVAGVWCVPVPVEQ
jgi:hypothetical protein